MTTSGVVVFYLCVLQLVHVSGQTLTGPTSGVLGSSVHLICTFPESWTLGRGITFFRADITGPLCIVNITTCFQLQATSNYSCGCVPGQSRDFYLNISSLTKQDDEKWRCSNIAIFSNNFNLSVYYMDAPVLTFSQTEVMENASVHLECRVSSNPTAEMIITNLDNNTDIVDSKMTNTRQVDINRAQCLHNGTFQCLVNNRALSRSETVTQQLSVLCFPRRDVRQIPLTTVSTALNEIAHLVAEVIANPSPNFTWSRLEGDNLIPIRGSTISTVHSSRLKSVLQIRVTSSKDLGQYAVKVQNTVGETLLKYQLTAKEDNADSVCLKYGESSNVGVIAGVVTAACLLTILFHVLLCLYRRSVLTESCCFTRAKSRPPNSNHIQEINAASLSPYSDLDHSNSDRQTYTALKTFQFNQVATESIASQESVSPTYENTDVKKKDSEYMNAGSS